MAREERKGICEETKRANKRWNQETVLYVPAETCLTRVQNKFEHSNSQFAKF